MRYSPEELERLDRISQRYPKRYFASFRVQRQFFSATLDDSFFKLWFDQLTNFGKDLKTNFSRSQESCTWLLLLHPDCPDWLRDHYRTFPNVEGRRAAILGGSEDYQLRNIELVLADRSRTIKEGFYHRLQEALVRSSDIDPTAILRALSYVKNSDDRSLNLRKKAWQVSPIVSFYKEFKTVLDEGVASLVNPNPRIRSKAEFYFKQDSSIQEKIQLILKG